MTYTKAQKAERRTKAIEYLRDMLKPGDTVYCRIASVASSGMSRQIALLIPTSQERDGATCLGIANISYLVADACGYRYNPDKGAVSIGGCGMDMGFALVYDLAGTLWPNGYQCTGDKHPRYCQSSDHGSGDMTKRNDYTPERLHKDSGYALRSTWI